MVGPAVADCGEVDASTVAAGSVCTYSSVGWYRDFLGNCTDCRIDAVALHLYYCSDQDQMNKIMALYAVAQRPIWLTEFACNAPESESQPITFAQALLPRLESLDIVQRYSWFISYCGGCTATDLLYDGIMSAQGAGASALTAFGSFYAHFDSSSMWTVSAANPTVRIDCGAAAMSWDSDGVRWLADDLFRTAANGSAGHTQPLFSGATVALPTSSAVALPSSFVFQSLRSGPVLYTLPVATAGTYSLTLLFSDPWSTAVSQRVFSVLVQGVVREASVDVFQRAGGANRAIAISFDVTADANPAPTPMAVTVQLQSVSGSLEEPIITALTLQSSSTGGSSSPAGVSPVYANVGGSSFTDASNRTWLSHADFTRWTTSSGSDGALSVGVSSTPILGAPADLALVYQSYAQGSGLSVIRVPAPASGVWLLTLMFLEPYWSEPGGRVFSVHVQGEMVRPSLDVFVSAGGVDRAFDLTVPATVTPSMPWIVIQLTSMVDQPILSGITAVPSNLGTTKGSTPNAAAAAWGGWGGSPFSISAWIAIAMAGGIGWRR